jgi:hypothetical protein
MAAGHGGARIGAGRKPATARNADAPAPPRYGDALSYLEAVVRGDEPADGLRIAAAKAVLPFQAPKKRAPVASPPPEKLRSATTRAAERTEREAFHARAAEVRRKFQEKKK